MSICIGEPGSKCTKQNAMSRMPSITGTAMASRRSTNATISHPPAGVRSFGGYTVLQTRGG